MPRGKKTDATMKAKIIEEKVNNPDLSSRDIEKTLWIPHETVSRIVGTELAQVGTESSRIADLIDTNNRIQSLVDARIQKMLANEQETIRVSELVSLRESTFKQNRLIQGENTEIVWVNGYDLLQDIRSGKITKDNAYEVFNKKNETV